MYFKSSRAEAVEELNHFIENNLIEYSKLRNFDFGPQKRDNTSCLSPYVTHGLINEVEIINKSLKRFSFVKNEKFIQEVLWRVYWKGWLELRPDVWRDYLNELNDIVTSKKKITIQHTYTCYCYGDNPLPTKYFIIEGDKLTNKYIIDELIKQDLTMNCNHIFLEGFNELHDNVYEIMVGS